MKHRFVKVGTGPSGVEEALTVSQTNIRSSGVSVKLTIII
jgi:hypothetical protein